MWTRPSVADFKAYFFRDFNYASDSDQKDLTKVVDADITKAMDQAEANFNPNLAWGKDPATAQAFLWIAAFYLVEDLKTSQAGLSSQANFPVSSKSVAGVAVGYQVPEAYLKDPYISMFTANGYGLKYLSFAIPQMIGQVRVADGTTTWR